MKMATETPLEKMKREMEEAWAKALKEIEVIKTKALEDKARRDAEALTREESRKEKVQKSLMAVGEEVAKHHLEEYGSYALQGVDVSRQQVEDAVHATKVMAEHFVDRFKESV